MNDDILDLLVVGAGPTGIAIGAEAKRSGLSVLVVDQGPLTAAIQGYPSYMTFFTTRDRLEICGVPFAIPEDKPSRRQALVYYREVARRFEVPLALHEEVLTVRLLPEGADDPESRELEIETRKRDGERGRHRARSVALATGYFFTPRRLGVPGEDLPWVHARYLDPYPHFGERVVVVGGGNSAAEAALELWRNGAGVTLVHRRSMVKPRVKYWLKPDLENRIAEGSIAARFDCEVAAFHRDRQVEIRRGGATELLPADAAYVLIGYAPDVAFLERCGVAVDPESLVPPHDPATCASLEVPGLYIAGTLQAGRHTGRIFIENTRDHGEKIVRHLLAERRPARVERAR